MKPTIRVAFLPGTNWQGSLTQGQIESHWTEPDEAANKNEFREIAERENEPVLQLVKYEQLKQGPASMISDASVRGRNSSIRSVGKARAATNRHAIKGRATGVICKGQA